MKFVKSSSVYMTLSLFFFQPYFFSTQRHWHIANKHLSNVNTFLHIIANLISSAHVDHLQKASSKTILQKCKVFTIR